MLRQSTARHRRDIGREVALRHAERGAMLCRMGPNEGAAETLCDHIVDMAATKSVVITSPDDPHGLCTSKDKEDMVEF